MSYNNSGIISKNERKEKESHSDYRGSATVDGKEYYVDAWVKDRRDGSGKYLSMAFKEKAKPADNGSETSPGAPELPF